MGTSSDLGHPFRSRQRSWGLGWEENMLSCYDIRAEGALPPSITVIARVLFTKEFWFSNKIQG